MLFTSTSSRPPKISVGRKIAYEQSARRSASSTAALPRKYGKRRVCGRIADAEMDDAAHVSSGRGVEEAATALDRLGEGRAALLERTQYVLKSASQPERAVTSASSSSSRSE